jgi:hypothetical protein
MSNFELIDKGWDKVIKDAVAEKCTEVRVICPFIKMRAARRLWAAKCPELIQVITRFNQAEMCDGVSDTEALRLLLESGAKVRGVRNLHSKLYLFGERRVIVTSANLTEAALLRNHEFGFVSNDTTIIKRCREYFDALWKRSGSDLTLTRLEEWEKRIAKVQAAGARPSARRGLSDEGANAGFGTEVIVVPPRVAEAPQAFIKFFGHHANRLSRDFPVLKEVEGSGCHWACTYPKTKRPRQVRDGAVMFMGRLVENPQDTIIYGRAIALAHVPGRDEASPAEIKKRGWKQKWSLYVRVHDAEFLARELGNGISMREMMGDLGSDSFVSTQTNARNGSGNTDPRRACRQQASVYLTDKAFAWINQRLEKAFTAYGKLTPAELEQLDWPENDFSSGSRYV